MADKIIPNRQLRQFGDIGDDFPQPVRSQWGHDDSLGVSKVRTHHLLPTILERRSTLPHAPKARMGQHMSWRYLKSKSSKSWDLDDLGKNLMVTWRPPHIRKYFEILRSNKGTSNPNASKCVEAATICCIPIMPTISIYIISNQVAVHPSISCPLIQGCIHILQVQNLNACRSWSYVCRRSPNLPRHY